MIDEPHPASLARAAEPWQRFTTRLLSERNEASAIPVRGERVGERVGDRVGG